MHFSVVCLEHNSKTNDITKVLKLGIRNDLGISKKILAFGVSRSQVRVNVRVQQ